VLSVFGHETPTRGPYFSNGLSLDGGRRVRVQHYFTTPHSNSLPQGEREPLIVPTYLADPRQQVAFPLFVCYQG
jgi:hypothetical protein